MNEGTAWRKIIGTEKADKRLRDVELVLRCLALSERGDKYEKPMKGFLNTYMEAQRGQDEDFSTLEESFAETTSFLVDQLGEKPFHLRGRLNYGAMDSLITTLLKGFRPENLGHRFAKLLENERYNSAITFNTSDESEVETRLELALVALGDA
jgi:hypothetical protein